MRYFVKCTQATLELSERIGYNIAGNEITTLSPVNIKDNTVRVYVIADRGRGVKPTGPITINWNDVENTKE